MLESKAFSYSKPLGIQIGSNNRGPCPACQDTQYDADGALADGQNGLARLQAEGFYALHAGVDRFDKTSLLEGDAVRDLYRSLADNPIHNADIFREASAGRFKSRGAPYPLIGEALGECLVTAVVALAAGDVMEDHHTVTWLEAAHVGADGGDYAGSFMAEDPRRGMGSCGDFFEVRATDAAGVNAEE